MGYALFWILSLTSALLGVAAVTAAAARRPGRPGQVVPPPLVAGVLLSIGVGIAVGIRSGWLSTYVASLVLAFGAGAAVLLCLGRRRSGTPRPTPAAGRWPWGKLTVATLVSILLQVATVWGLELELRSQLATLRADAYGTMGALKRPVYDPQENAAPCYRAAFQILRRDRALADAWRRMRHVVRTKRLPAAAPEASDFLTSREVPLTLLREGAFRPSFSPEGSPLDPWDLRRQSLRDFRLAAHLLTLDAHVKAAAGRLHDAVEDLEACRRMADHVRGVPALVNCTIGSEVARLAFDALKDVLGRAVPGPDLHLLVPTPDRGEIRAAFLRGLRMEEAHAVALATLEVQRCRAADALSTFARILVWPDLVSAYRRRRLDLQQLLARPFHAARRQLERLADSIEEDRGVTLAVPAVPNLADLNLLIARDEATNRLTALALAAVAHRARHGEYPASLEQLVPRYLAAVPTDPFNGRPLKTVRLGDGMLLYSVGPDGTGDGGREARGPGDLAIRLGEVWRLDRPAPGPALR